MRPSQFASELRRIASLIENSSKPNKQRVASSLKRLIAAVGSEPSNDNIYQVMEAAGEHDEPYDILQNEIDKLGLTPPVHVLHAEVNYETGGGVVEVTGGKFKGVVKIPWKENDTFKSWIKNNIM